MRIHTYSQAVAEALRHFTCVVADSGIPEYYALCQRISRSPCDVMIIGLDDPDIGRAETEPEAQAVVALHKAWQCINREPSVRSERFRDACSCLMRIGEPQLLDEHVMAQDEEHLSVPSRLLRLRDPSMRHWFAVLLKRNERLGLPPYPINLLASICQIERGYLPIHAAGVIRGGRLFLFAGPSGSGKSTIAASSLESGSLVLDEDQVLVRPLSGDRFTADAWGYGVQPCNAPLAAFFSLLQSEEDRLTPLSQTHTARLLLERHQDIMTAFLPAETIVRALKSASAIARRIPAYELHFRKSPDFWKLIDERFPA